MGMQGGQQPQLGSQQRSTGLLGEIGQMSQLPANALNSIGATANTAMKLPQQLLGGLFPSGGLYPTAPMGGGALGNLGMNRK